MHRSCGRSTSEGPSPGDGPSPRHRRISSTSLTSSASATNVSMSGFVSVAPVDGPSGAGTCRSGLAPMDAT